MLRAANSDSSAVIAGAGDERDFPDIPEVATSRTSRREGAAGAGTCAGTGAQKPEWPVSRDSGRQRGARDVGSKSRPDPGDPESRPPETLGGPALYLCVYPLSSCLFHQFRIDETTANYSLSVIPERS